MATLGEYIDEDATVPDFCALENNLVALAVRLGLNLHEHFNSQGVGLIMGEVPFAHAREHNGAKRVSVTVRCR